MNDRELLELAAKAAGIKLRWIQGPDDDDCIHPVRLNDERSCEIDWLPLEDDGDALRLAVSLRISLFCSANNTACDIPCTDEYVWEEAIDGSAARRAIVRAAAEIGKSMEGK